MPTHYLGVHGGAQGPCMSHSPPRAGDPSQCRLPPLVAAACLGACRGAQLWPNALAYLKSGGEAEREELRQQLKVGGRGRGAA